MARHFAKAESRKQMEVLERGKLVAAAGSDGVYRRARLEEILRGHMQYLDRLEVFTVDCGEKEMVKTSDLNILPDSLGVEIFPPAATKVVVGGIMMEGQGDRELVYRGRVLLHLIETTHTAADPKPGQRAVGMGSLRPSLM